MQALIRTSVLAVMSLAAIGLASSLHSVHAAPNSAQDAAQTEAAKPEFYTAKVRPIFVEHCERCHLGTAHRGGLNMETRANLLKGGRDGVVVVPGDPENSLLIKLIRHQGPANDPMPMPPQGAKVSDPEIATVAQWIKAGAVMP